MIKKIFAVLCSAVIAVSLSGCVIVKTGEEGKLTGEVAFDAQTIVAKTWDDGLVPDITDRANDLNELIASSGGDFSKVTDKGHYSMGDSGTLNFIVSAVGKVTAVSDKSMAGTMDITVDGVPDKYKLSIQTGPVIKGSSVRDSLTYIDYNDYTNQTEWGQIKTNINDKIVSDVIGKCDISAANGKTVTFIGCFTVDTSDQSRVLITPVTMTVD